MCKVNEVKDVVKTVEWENFSCKLFDGFYESNLYNSDTMYYFNEYEEDIPEGYGYDITDFNGFCADVSEQCADSLWDNLYQDVNNPVILDIKYKGISSPTYYNFTTDKLKCDITLNVTLLEKYCFEDNAEKFDLYLHENWSDRDGFWSFVKNNIRDFKEEYQENNEADKTLGIMIEYYLLNEVDLEKYMMDTAEKADQTIREYAELVKI
jgi:hypothetical protein